MELPQLKITKNSNKFRGPAIHYQKYNTYTFAPYGTTEYIRYWTDEQTRCINGYTAEDGDYIPGYFYFYLNYFPIILVTEIDVETKKGVIEKRSIKKSDFPRFYDYDRWFFECVEYSEAYGKHMVVLKARRKGYSYKVGSMLTRNFYFFRESKGFALAAEAEFLTKDGILTKAWDGFDFIDQNTAWYKKREVKNTLMHRQASYTGKDATGVQTVRGYKSEIMGVTLKNDPQKARGKAGKLIIFEEAGKFPNLLQAWQIARPSVEQGSHVFGMMLAFGTGGCVTAGTKVFDKNGNLFNIENLPKSQGILGYDGKNISKEDITYWQDYKEKECIKLITNTGRELNCSIDHPIYTAIQSNNNKRNIKGFEYIPAIQLVPGNNIGVIEEIPFESTKLLDSARLLGWLIGDGTYGDKQSPRIANCEKEILDYIETTYEHTIQVERLTKTGKIYKEILIKNFVPVLRNVGIYGQTKLNKRLPINIHSYNKESVVELLGGLFDTDGYVNLRYNKKRNTPIAEISIAQASIDLLYEIMFLLNRLGIHGRIRERKPRKCNPIDKNSWYEFTIADSRSLLRFANEIKLFPKEKQDRLNRIKKVYSNIKPHKVYRGLRTEKIVQIESIGIQRIYNLTANITHTYLANGIITHNTEDADFESLKELFEKPKAYNCLELENIWDESCIGQKCGFFIPQYANMDGHYKNDEDPNDPYNGLPFMDEDGNTDVLVSKKYILQQRDLVIKNASDKRAIDRHIAEQPVTPAEATLDISSNIFPKADLQRQLAHIRNTTALKHFKQVGDLYFDNEGKVKWSQADLYNQRDVVKYRLDPSDDPTGQIVIWEHPRENPPWGLYIAGNDPYDQDKSGTNSLGSTFIYKRFMNGEPNTETIVAEYTGRPNSANEYYENVRKLLVYYNATMLYENEKKGLFNYFERMNCTHMLADQPNDIIKDIIKDSKVDRGKGIHMNIPIKDWAEGLIKDWLNEEYEPGKKNLTKILSEPLLEELIAYNEKGNFDRFISFGLVMLYRQQLHKVFVKDKKKQTRDNLLFPDGLFSFKFKSGILIN